MATTLSNLVDAKSLNRYYAGVKETTLVEAMFPAEYSNDWGFDILKSFNGGAAQVIQGSNFDADPFFRDWEIKTHGKENKKFFREAMALNEKQRFDLLQMLQSKDQNLIDAYMKQIFEQFAGKKGFLASVRALAAYTASQFLATGKVVFDTGNGTATTINYGLDNKYRETLTGTHLWSAATSDPLEDLRRWKETLEDDGKTVNIALMNKFTYKSLKNHPKVKDLLEKQKILPTPKNIKAMIEDMTELTIGLWDEKVSLRNQVRKVFPDNVVTLIPNGPLGKMAYGPTPAKTDQIFGEADGRDIVDISGTYATLEMGRTEKAVSVNNVYAVIQAMVAPNPTIIDAMFIANVG